jgi:hypothetical protein
LARGRGAMSTGRSSPSDLDLEPDGAVSVSSIRLVSHPSGPGSIALPSSHSDTAARSKRTRLPHLTYGIRRSAARRRTCLTGTSRCIATVEMSTRVGIARTGPAGAAPARDGVAGAVLRGERRLLVMFLDSRGALTVNLKPNRRLIGVRKPLRASCDPLKRRARPLHARDGLHPWAAETEALDDPCRRAPAPATVARSWHEESEPLGERRRCGL